MPLFGNGGGWVNGWAAKTPQSEIPRQEEPERPEPEQPSPEPEDDPELGDDLDEDDPPELATISTTNCRARIRNCRPFTRTAMPILGR